VLAESPAVFATTHWSVVLAAGESSSSAFERLCQVYWYPIYAFLRRLGHSSTDAEDLAQGFFAYLLSTELVAKADRNIGRFRTFLLGCLQRWLSNQAQRDRAARRGGGSTPLSLDALAPEQRYSLEPVTEETPASQYERTWAETLVGETMARLENESSRKIRSLTSESHRRRSHCKAWSCCWWYSSAHSRTHRNRNRS
jgi:RNA polymerase sigma-70 factor (ECF subfamily)